MKKLIGAGLMALFAITLFIAATSPVADGYKIGDRIDDISLKNTAGELVTLSDYEDVKGYIVIFTCNTCPYAVMYEDRIIELHEKYAPQGYPVVAINPNDPDVKPGDSYAAMQERATEKGFKFNYLFDADQSVYPKWGATKTPHAYLVDNNMVLRYIGAIDDNAQDAEGVTKKYIENGIAALDKGEQLDPEVTKAVGCSIKVKR